MILLIKVPWIHSILGLKPFDHRLFVFKQRRPAIIQQANSVDGIECHLAKERQHVLAHTLIRIGEARGSIPLTVLPSPFRMLIVESSSVPLVLGHGKVKARDSI